ncbi:MAG: FAD-dependent monooxygenase [Chloroflexota bacterium]
MRILISGAGPAGLSLAYWLQQRGFTPVVVEKAPALRREGYGIDFLGTGFDVAHAMNIIPRLQAQQIRVKDIAYINDVGAEIAVIGARLLDKVTRGKYLALMRYTLVEALYSLVERSVEVRFHQALKQVRQNTDSVTVTFDNDQVETFDLLIGTDGVHSNTRRLIFGSDSEFEHYLGLYVACYPLLDRYGIGDRRLHYTEAHRQTVAYATERAGEIVALYLYETPDEGDIPREKRLVRLQEQFSGMGWITSQLLADIQDPDGIFMDRVVQVKMPAWSLGRVALLGDACGCMTFASAQGASMALGGAYVLAEALQKQADYQAAFLYYESVLRAAIEQRQQTARGVIKTLLPRNKIEFALQLTMLNVVLRDPFAGVLRRVMHTESLWKQFKQRGQNYA